MEHPLTTYIISDTILSSLGFGTQANLNAIHAYWSALAMKKDGYFSEFKTLAGRISRERIKLILDQHSLIGDTMPYTRLEQLFILAIREVLQHSRVSLKDEKCGLILSTTKGNIDQLAWQTKKIDQSVFLWKMAQSIARYFQAGERVHLISNACISGVSALIVGKRMLESGIYNKVVVVGGDFLCPFITSGFHSFKSLSEQLCRPYDAQRNGLNLGEACGAVVLSTEGTEKDIILSGGAISNDANHISGPSRTGDGLFFAIRQAMEEAGTEAKDISFINAHGTATVYNDEMESKAITLAHLEHVPVQSLKGYFGHTLGASGIVETIVSMHELKNGILYGTLGYESLGVPMPILVSNTHQELPMKHCVKTASGFGGCNASIVLSLPSALCHSHTASPLSKGEEVAFGIVRSVKIENSRINVNEETIFQSETENFELYIREAFKNLGGNNMKFYKMDDLCKLGYIAAEYLLKDITFAPTEMGIVLANANSSLHTDIKHEFALEGGEEGEAVASPATFVYTLPNVVIGEICIRHKIQGENTFFIERNYQPEKLAAYAQIAMKKGKLKYCIVGWCDLLNNNYKAEFKLIKTL